MKKYLTKIKENKEVVALFLLSTIFFIFQHKFFLSWDFSAYLLNARYLFSGGTYFELYRAPVTPVILGIFLIFQKFGSYLYLLLASGLFFYGNVKLSNSLFSTYLKSRKNKRFLRFLFYFFSLSGFVLLYGTYAGTELLGLAFFELFLAGIINKKISGHYLGLAMLIRYNFLIFFPFLLFSKDYKKIIKNILTFMLILFPWLLFNYLNFGNWFASIIDSYALNVYLRTSLTQPFDVLEILKMMGWFLPFFIIGLVASVKNLFKSKKNLDNRFTVLFILIFVLMLIDVINIPFKVTRYLFNLSLPIAFFSAIGLFFLKERFKIPKRIIIRILFIVFLITVFALLLYFYSIRNYDDRFSNAAEDIVNLKIQECEILSPHWVHVTYYTENIYPLGENDINQSIRQNKIILIFKEDSTMDDLFNKSDIKKYPILLEKEKYIFLGKANVSEDCPKKYIYNRPMINNHCEILSTKFVKIGIDKIMFDSCKLINNK